MRRWTPLLLSGGVLVVVAALLLSLLTGLPHGDRPRTDAAVEAASTSTCADVLLVGVDGNAERARSGHVFGPTVDAVAGGYVRRIQATRRVAVLHVGMRDAALSVMTRAARSRRTARTAIPPAAVRRWMRPVSDAVRRTVPRVESSLQRCPAQQAVLVGYAQGAAVVHRTLLRLAGARMLGRVTGVALLSDPDRHASTHATLDGDPRAPRKHAGIVDVRLRPVADVPAATTTYRAWEVCRRGDLVCDPSGVTVRRAAATATSYAGRGRVAPALVRTRGALDARTRTWPVPTPRQRVVSVRQGQAIAVQLAASGGSGLVWSAGGPLPAGTTVSPSGRLTGTVDTPGLYTLDVSVTGSSPATPAAHGSVVLAVSGAVVGISSGGQTSCETDSDGSARCWGRNDYGQLGNGTRTGSTAPVTVAGTGWAQVATSGSTTCGVRTNHTLWCWGLNNYAQTGHAVSGPLTKPRQVGTSAVWSRVAVGWSHACAVRTDGGLWCWGQNRHGQLGIGSVGGARSAPVRVLPGSTWSTVSVGGWRTCAVRSDASAWCWGDNAFGGVGDATRTRRTSPTRVGGDADWRSVVTSWNTTCGVHAAGALDCWGKNLHGEVGDGTTANRLAPVRVATGHEWLTVSPGDGSTCALETSGVPWCWGDNRYHQVSATGPARVAVPTARTAPSGLTTLSSGWLLHCGASVSVTCWGSSEVGALGASTTARVISPREQRALDRMSPSQVAAHDLGGRPAVSSRVLTRNARSTTSFRVMTYNVLGSNHTKPGADAQSYAPARLRAEWSSTLIDRFAPGLLGTQEAQPDQIGDFARILGSTYAIYPGASQGYDATPQSLMFRRAAWTKVWSSTISVPFVGGWRPQPVTRLKSTATGAQVYFINVHFSPGSRQSERQRAMDILVAQIKTLAKDQLPIVLTGDFNEKRWVFCQVTGRTPLRAASGGHNSGGTCTPPATMRLDWIFASRGRWSSYRLVDGPEVDLTSDHAVQYATYSVG